MRNIINFIAAVALTLFAFWLVGCSVQAPVDPVVIDHGDEEPADPPVEMSNILLALYDGATLRLWDGNTLNDAYVGHVIPAGRKKLAIEDVLYYFDENGASVASKWLPVIPTAVVTTESSSLSRASVVYEDDVITLEDIPPEEAYALGARYKNYTRVFENGVEIGAWYLNEWECTDVIKTASGHILAIDGLGRYINLTDDKEIDTAYEDGIMLYNMETQYGYIADASGSYEVTWSMNYFDHSRWQLADGVWYTENGYTWTPETGVISNANCLYDLNAWATMPELYTGIFPDMPYLLPAGVHEENGEEVTYWIECNTGKLLRHIPSIDRLDMVIELYDGPDTRSGGIPYFNTLDPVIIDGLMYYHEDGAVKTFDLTTGLVSVFSVDQEVIEW